MLLRSRTPLHGDLQSRGHFAKILERPTFCRVAGKGVDNRKILDRLPWNSDVRNPFRGRRKRGEERERKMAHSVSKLRAMGPVPGIDGVERFELRDAGAFHHAHQIQTGIGDSPRTIREADQRQYRARRPGFGVTCARGFKRR